MTRESTRYLAGYIRASESIVRIIPDCSNVSNIIYAAIICILLYLFAPQFLISLSYFCKGYGNGDQLVIFVSLSDSALVTNGRK